MKKIKTYIDKLSINELFIRANNIIAVLNDGKLSKQNIRILENTFELIIKRYKGIAFCNNCIW
jgi:hypothetical protein